MTYYYLGASLPMLFLDRPAPIGLTAFRRSCREQMRPADGEAIQRLLDADGEGVDHPFVRRWRNGERQLRNAVARARAARLGRDAAPHLRPVEGVSVTQDRRVAEAFTRGTPLERELELDRIRWSLLDELAGLQPFTLAWLMAYALKLRLVERWAGLDAGMGEARLEGAVAAARPAGAATQGGTP
jgi:hypothetical protein